MLLRSEIPVGPRAAAAARRLVRSLRTHLDGELLEDVTLLVSELVTNCFRHADMLTGEQIELIVSRYGPRVRIEVADPGHAVTQPALRAVPDEAGGWGLRIVEQLASRWGVDRVADRTTVWFELEEQA